MMKDNFQKAWSDLITQDGQSQGKLEAKRLSGVVKD